MTDWSREFSFELRVCAWAEREWPPDGDLPEDRQVVVGRQLGTRDRRWDTVVVVADADGLRRRAAFGERALDRALLRVVQHAPATYEWYRDALPEWTSWRYVREAVHRADDRGLIETRRDGNRLQLRRRFPYPDWVVALVAVENKPDLDRSAARNLAGQLETDVALGLADEAWVATRRTGADVEPALLADAPVEAGVFTIDPDAVGTASAPVEVLWHPRELGVDDPGTRIVERPSGGRHDMSAARFEYVDPEWKALTRLAIAERAYERGWRSFVDGMRSDCRHFGLVADGGHLLPHCGEKGRCPSARECSARCGAFEPEPPGWRTRGWPIEGGPGVALSRLLDARRARRRPSEPPPDD